ncbi:DUF6151 family protein [Paracoccus albus]|uniref:DUF6151 family protein n=1 Tax=Paracoccus albus TaxID=3017784 RepID=UPI0022F08C3D|nr:DUF6151 family protein [Paracoccus albus]WBU59167.1 DUF6151 family protein [Paracoccus albus]
MQIQCDCGAFKANLTNFPANSPGRLMCYCDDCQHYLEKIDREDLLDAYGGTEVIPVYPSEISIAQGREQLVCNQLSRKGLYRWSTRCCNSPIGNIKVGFPWLGIFHSAVRAANPDYAEKLGPVKSRISGRYAKGEPPFKIASKIGFKDMLTVLPFVVKGKLTGKHKNSPLFEADNSTPIVPPRQL